RTRLVTHHSVLNPTRPAVISFDQLDFLADVIGDLAFAGQDLRREDGAGQWYTVYLRRVLGGHEIPNGRRRVRVKAPILAAGAEPVRRNRTLFEDLGELRPRNDVMRVRAVGPRLVDVALWPYAPVATAQLRARNVVELLKRSFVSFLIE